MAIPLQPKIRDRNPAQTLRRLQAYHNGWSLIPSEAKALVPKGWPKLKNDAPAIEAWNNPKLMRAYAGTGVRVEGLLCVLDIDVSHAGASQGILRRLAEAYPDVMAHALCRTSGTRKVALFFLVDKPIGMRRTARYGDGECVEVFGSLVVRYFAIEGPHPVEGRFYTWKAGAPWDTRLDSLPVFKADDIGALIDMCDDELGKHLPRIMNSELSENAGTTVYDLEPGQTFICADGEEVELTELEASLGPDSKRMGLLSWADWRASESKSHCTAWVDWRGHLMVVDFNAAITHRWKADAPTPLDTETLGEILREAGIGEIEAEAASETSGEAPGEAPDPGHDRLRHSDLIGHAPTGKFIYRPTGDLWPASTVDRRLGKITLDATDEDGKKIKLSSSTLIMRTNAVEQMSWFPGAAEILADTVMLEGGLQAKKGARIFNLYRGPAIHSGDARAAMRWVDHVHLVYEASDAARLIRYLAHAVQFPGVKINHGLLLGGAPGIGKDSLLAPLRAAVGSWNFIEARPPELFGEFNKWQRAVVLRVNEMHDLGEYDMYALYERMKPITAAPPEVLPVNEKYLGGYFIPNVVKVVMTTNYKVNGVYLPADDRRTDVMWSPVSHTDRESDSYFEAFHGWLAGSGEADVAAYLRGLDLCSFSPTAPPPKTEAFWSIVNANRSPTDSNIGDLVTSMTEHAGRPPTILTLFEMQDFAWNHQMPDVGNWLSDIRHRRQIPASMERAGYLEVPNPDATDRRWFISGRKQSVYRHTDATLRDAIVEIEARIASTNRAKGKSTPQT